MEHDVICQKFSRKSGKFNVNWIKQTEMTALQSASDIFTLSEKDSSLIESIYGIKSTPVNVYLKAQSFTYSTNIISKCFCFYGAWNRQENIEGLVYFIDKVLPLIKKIYISK